MSGGDISAVGKGKQKGKSKGKVHVSGELVVKFDGGCFEWQVRAPQSRPRAKSKARSSSKGAGKCKGGRKGKRNAGRTGNTTLGDNGTDDGNGKKGRLDLSSLEEQLKRISDDIASARASGGALLCLSISAVQRRLTFQDVGAVERMRVSIGMDPGTRAWSPRCQRKSRLKVKEVRSTSARVT